MIYHKEAKMKNILLCALMLISFAIPVHAQEIEKLVWMAGTWTQKKDGEIVQETWLGPRGKMMVAVNLATSGKLRQSFEFLRIVDGPNGLAYLASPGGKTPTEFKLKEIGDKKVVFENLSNDFPQRILYWVDADGAMKARIEGNIHGKASAIEWRFEREK
jgi:Domain of unknown function (DUF6265)